MLQRPHHHLPGPLAPPRLPRSQHQHRPGFYNSTEAFLQQRQEKAAREGQRQQGEGGEVPWGQGLAFPGLGSGLAQSGKASVWRTHFYCHSRGGNPTSSQPSQFSGSAEGLGLTKACWAVSLSGSLFVTSWSQGPTLQPQYFSRLHSDTHKWPWSQLDQKSVAVAGLDRSPGHCVKRLQADGTDPTPYPVSLPVANSVVYLDKENRLAPVCLKGAKK